MNYIKQNHLSILIIIFLVISSVMGGSKNLGATAPTSTFTFTPVMQQGLRIAPSGTTGSLTSKVLEGTCNATQKTPGSFAASTTMQHYCAVTGATSGDRVLIQLPVGAGVNADGAGSLGGGFQVVSANATSTGFIQFTLLNSTGAATSSYVQASTSIVYRVTN